MKGNELTYTTLYAAVDQAVYRTIHWAARWTVGRTISWTVYQNVVAIDASQDPTHFALDDFLHTTDQGGA